MSIWEPTITNLCLFIALTCICALSLIKLLNSPLAFSKHLIFLVTVLLLGNIISLINLYPQGHEPNSLMMRGPLLLSLLIPLLWIYFTFKFLDMEKSIHTIVASLFLIITIANIILNIRFVNIYGLTLSIWIICFVGIMIFWIQARIRLSDSIEKLRLNLIILVIGLSSLLPLDIFPRTSLQIPFPVFNVLTVTGLFLLVVILNNVPIFKPFLVLNHSMRYITVISILSIPIAWLSAYLLQITSTYPAHYKSLMILILLVFIFPYIQFGFPYLFKKLFNSFHRLTEISNNFLNDIIKLKYPDRLAQQILSITKENTNLNALNLIIKMVESNQFIVYAEHNNKLDLTKQYYLIFNWFKIHSHILTLSDINFLPKEAPNRLLWREFFDNLNATALVPLVVSQEFVGLIYISNDVNKFSPSDYLFLLRLKPIFSIALYNAYFYDQIRQLSRGLWEVNECLHEKIEDKNQALESALARMVSLKEEQKSFFTMSSHNLKTPLTSIKAATSMLWSQLPADEFKHGLNRILSENIARLEDLLNNIILISKLQDNHLPDFHKIDFNTIVDLTQKQVDEVFADKHLNWTLKFDEQIRWINGNQNYIKLVCFHLIYNAGKFSTFGGQIKITIKKLDSQARLKYNHLLNPELDTDNCLEFSIADEGEGIPDHEKESIFSSFHQVKESLKRYQGNGLGLFIVKSILNYHHGAITLDSTLHHGAVFSFVLPLDQSNCLWRQEHE